MRHWIAAAMLLAAPALAQTKPSILESGLTTGKMPPAGQAVSTRDDIANAIKPKVDMVNGALTNPALTGGAASGTDLSAARVALPGGLGDTMARLLSGAAPITGHQVAGAPSIATCPVGNCPPAGTTTGFGGTYGGPTMSAATVYGSSTPDQHPQFQSNIGLYVKDGGNSGGKAQYVASYAGAMQGPSAGATWALNTESIRGACPGGPNSMFGQPGSGIPFGDPGCPTSPGSLGNNTTIGYELDHSNFDADSVTHGSFIVGLYINTLSKYTSGAGITFGNSAGQNAAIPPSWHHAIELAPNTAADAAIYDLSGSAIGYHAAGVHAQSSFQDDASGGTTSIALNGTKTAQDISFTSNSPAALNIGGRHAAGSIVDASASPVVLQVNGAHSVASFNDASNGPASINIAGNHTLTDININTNSPSAIAIAGSHPVAGINEQSIGPSGLNIAGAHTLASITTQSDSSSIALLAAPNQRVCWNGIYSCMFYSASTGRYYITNGANQIVASLDNNGNMVLKGTLLQNAAP